MEEFDINKQQPEDNEQQPDDNKQQLECNEQHLDGNEQPPDGNELVPKAPNYDLGAAALKPIWGRVIMAAILAICAFAGAFFGIFYICRTSIYKESKFFDAFIAKWSGVTENRVEVDYISGEYRGDAIELSEKVLNYTVLIRAGSQSGSGVVYSKVNGQKNEYYILTNYHVIEGASQIQIEVHDTSEADTTKNRYAATLEHTDIVSDIALLRVTCPKELAVPTHADSSKARHGQTIIVAGNPLGRGFSVSLGYISNPYRVSTANNNIPQMSLDVSVNFGNSGGGAYDSAGNLIALVSSKASGDDIDGIGYAIPINTVNSIVSDLLVHQYVQNRPALGVSTLSLSNESLYSLAEKTTLNGCIFPTQTPRLGLYIVESRSSVLRKGDRIVMVDDVPVSTNTEIFQILLDKNPGEVIPIIIERCELNTETGEINYTQTRVPFALVKRTYSDTDMTSYFWI